MEKFHGSKSYDSGLRPHFSGRCSRAMGSAAASGLGWHPGGPPPTFGAWLEMNRSPIDSSLRNIDFPDDPQRGIGGSVRGRRERVRERWLQPASQIFTWIPPRRGIPAWWSSTTHWRSRWSSIPKPSGSRTKPPFSPETCSRSVQGPCRNRPRPASHRGCGIPASSFSGASVVRPLVARMGLAAGMPQPRLLSNEKPLLPLRKGILEQLPPFLFRQGQLLLC